MLVSTCAISGKKKSTRFIKNQKASRLLSKVQIKTPLNNIPLISDILFILL